MSQHYDFVPAGSSLRGVNRRVVGLSAGVGKERFLKFARRYLIQLFRQIRLWLVGVKRGRVLQRLYLVNNRFIDLRISVATLTVSTPPKQSRYLLL